MENLVQEPAVAYNLFYTEEEYLKKQWENGNRYEYWDGALIAMAGATPRHADIVGNILIALKTSVKGKGCKVYNSDVLLKPPAGNIYFLPDVLVTCSKDDIESERFIANPSVVVEVLSPATELYDRTKKWEQYRKLKSLRYYLLVSQNEYLVEMFHRTNETSLLYFESFKGINEVIPLNELGVRIHLSEIYEGINIMVQSP